MRRDWSVQTMCVFREDIGMQFGIEKCAMLVIEKGKVAKFSRYRFARW